LCRRDESKGKEKERISGLIKGGVKEENDIMKID
jgi:hypothetical protein